MDRLPVERKQRRRPVALMVATGAGLLSLTTTAGLGGFQEAAQPGPRTLRVGEVIDQGQFTTQFVEAVVRPKSPSGLTKEKSLDIVYKVTNMSDKTASVGTVSRSFISIRPDGGPPILQNPPPKSTKSLLEQLNAPPGEQPKFQDRSAQAVGATAGAGHQLHPRMTTTVAYTFDIKEGVSPPQQLTIDVGTFEWRQDFFNESYSWEIVTYLKEGSSKSAKYLPVIAGRLTLPVREAAG